MKKQKEKEEFVFPKLTEKEIKQGYFWVLMGKYGAVKMKIVLVLKNEV